MASQLEDTEFVVWFHEFTCVAVVKRRFHAVCRFKIDMYCLIKLTTFLKEKPPEDTNH
jgi:hypothetical protein